MNLKKISNISNQSENSSNAVYIVNDYDETFIDKLTTFIYNVFGETGMSVWSLVPQIRHGNVFIIYNDHQNDIYGIAVIMRDWNNMKKCYLIDYAIKQELRGKGLGCEFLIIILKYLENKGFNHITLTVDPENTAAMRLYVEKLGFYILRTNDAEYGKGVQRHILELTFSNKS